ncbi:T9SS C-terminal target domain-containing protein [Hymenobacter persicinus]|uniref:T9SS C-terminal target domain-containing protein n=1 Tax=Hymenobacter persicinus TaxID=2025506 RepID=A0A4Q5LDI6_9BACT|nr:T9SS C-terminal target domain-containing protein [Hymenobacter persicinus]RYU81628.1 T9SS C-terminal target domain-containing protein [Hymenobacter persicinus]
MPLALPLNQVARRAGLATSLLLAAALRPAVAQVAVPISWVAAAPTTLGRSESQGVGVGNKVYVMGGFYDTSLQVTLNGEVYDVTTDTWAPMANMPEGITHSGTAEDGNNLYLAGGYVGQAPGAITDHVWRYNIPTNTWSAMPPLPGARGAGIIVRLGRELHFYGGAIRVGGTVVRDTPDHWALNLDAPLPAWTVRAPLPVATNHLGGAALNGKIYAIGGQLLGDEDFGNQSSIYEYDPTANAWTAKAPMPRALGHTANSVCVLNNRIVVIGGRLNGPAIAGQVVEFNPAANSWRDLTPLPLPLLAPVAAVAGGRLIINGGYDGLHPTVTSTWRSSLVLGSRPAQHLPAALALWPNPSTGRGVSLTVDTPQSGACAVQISNALGQDQQSLTFSKPAGAFRHDLTVALRPGVYSVALRQGSYYAVQKLVVN